MPTDPYIKADLSVIVPLTLDAVVHTTTSNVSSDNDCIDVCAEEDEPPIIVLAP